MKFKWTQTPGPLHYTMYLDSHYLLDTPPVHPSHHTCPVSWTWSMNYYWCDTLKVTEKSCDIKPWKIFEKNSILIFLMQKIGLFLQVLIMSRDIMLNLLWVSVNVSHWANSFQPFLLEELTSRFINLGFQFSKMLISSGQVKSWLWQAVKDILNVKAISPSILFRELSFSFSDLLDERNGKPQTPFQTFDLGQKL